MRDVRIFTRVLALALAVSVSGPLLAEDGDLSDPNWLDPGFGAATTCYRHFGDPSGEEQELLEHMNRARTDPVGEADRLAVFWWDKLLPPSYQIAAFFARPTALPELTMPQNHSDMASRPPAQPLVFDERLSVVARDHAQLMIDLDVQTFQHTSEAPIGERVTLAGYPSDGRLDTGIYGFGRDPLNFHGVLALDISQPADPNTGVRITPNRDRLMDPEFVAIGVAILDRLAPLNSTKLFPLGPKVLTTVSDAPVSPTRYLTGVCYVDRNGSGTYDRGEGIPGVRIETDRTTEYAVSAQHGGWAIPVPGDLGSVQVREIGMRGTASAVFGVQNRTADVDGENVKLDFVADDPAPVIATSTGPVAVADGALTSIPITVVEPSPSVDVVGAVALEIDVDHPQRGELRLTLESPGGTELVLFDAGSVGPGLAGTFPTTLAPVDDLRAFRGESVSGDWTVQVRDAAGGAVGTVQSCTLRILPDAGAPMAAPPARLEVTRFSARRPGQPGRGKLSISAEFDAGGRLLDTTADVHLLVREPGPFGQELVRAVLAGDSVKEQPARVRAKIRWHRKGTSRTQVKAKLSKLDLPVMPDRVVVELHAGGDILAQEIPLNAKGQLRGTFRGTTRPEAELQIRVDRVAATRRGGLLITGSLSVPGEFRLPAAVSPYVFIDGPLGFRIGDLHASAPVDPAWMGRISHVGQNAVERHVSPEHSQLLALPPFATATSPLGDVHLVSIELRTGVVRIRIDAEDALTDDVIEMTLRLGRHVTTTTVRPRVVRGRLSY